MRLNCLVGNKADLKDRRKVSKKEIDEWCEENGNPLYFEISAKSTKECAQVFQIILKAANGASKESLRAIPIKHEDPNGCSLI